jgi:hypothetical protein
MDGNPFGWVGCKTRARDHATHAETSVIEIVRQMKTPGRSQSI